MKKANIKIDGMSCAACSSACERALNKLEGVEATVNLPGKSASVTYNENLVSEKDLEKAIIDAGYKIGSDEIKKSYELQKLIVSIFFTAILMVISMGPMVGLVPHFKYNGIVQLILAVPVVLAGYTFYVKGFKSLIKLAPNMDSLVALGTGAAIIYSVYGLFVNIHHLYFESATVIITLILFGRYLEEKSKAKTGDAIKKLIDLAPKTAVVVKDGIEVEVKIEDVEVGNILVVKAGERIAVDGIITAGECSVDESTLTGESMPVDKSTGDKVFTATICKSGYITYEATRVGEDTTLSQIVKLVEEAGGSKAPIAKLADRVASVFVPVVTLIAILTCVVYLLLGRDMEDVFRAVVSILVIACPCSLGLATPTAIIVGTGKAATFGILFKNAVAIEACEKVDTVAFDKTGTITRGKPEVTDVISYDFDENYLLDIVASAESYSEHPVAYAIVNYMEFNKLDVSRFKTHTGNGITCRIGGQEVKIGSKGFVGADIDDDNLTLQGKTVVYISLDNVVIGSIAVADVMKDTSKSAIKKLNDMGIKTVMITGDNSKTANAIAESIGIKDVVSEVLPDGKVEAIKGLMKTGKVAMTGDGINDAPALVSADVGIAVSNGSDIAIESADVVLVNDNMERVPLCIDLSKAVIKNIKQNLFWAFFYNSIAIPVAVLGLLNPMIAAATMSFSSISVVLNALRLNRFRRK